MSRLEQPGSIPALVLPPGGMRRILTWNSAEYLVCDVSRQLNVLHQAASCFSRHDIRDIATHVNICDVLLIRLLKIRRQPTTGFALFGAHQVALETQLHEINEYTLICKLIWFFERLTWNPAKPLVCDVSRLVFFRFCFTYGSQDASIRVSVDACIAA
ncbi:hypothetical protein T265_05878 [Opisthorchis viverrini]|uniref:Uncharacterized protein n=1 Tax=Opisthorchis viverrini TaxID=6198 RepID=A0A074ZU93_OPIVI|nr:hypothetical protein T265_05878 [Opisthorchis viverrini]KER26970.1 hypothetical protein T265_05878 [Opisthorchis viverrini]